MLPKINAYLQGEGIGDRVVAAHKAGQAYTFELDGVSVSLADADVLVEPMQKAGFVSQTEHDLSVVLDANLTPALIEEGFVRELVSKVQTMRKEAGFEVTDHIALTYAGSGRIAEIFAAHSAEIAADTLSDSISERGRKRLCEGMGRQRRARDARRCKELSRAFADLPSTSPNPMQPSGRLRPPCF